MVESLESQLHIFCDSSTLAYGAVAFLRTETSTVLLMSESKVKETIKQSQETIKSSQIRTLNSAIRSNTL